MNSKTGRGSMVLQFATPMVAVFVAFFAEGWRQDRGLRQLAAGARQAIETELSQNWREFANSGLVLETVTNRLAEVVRAEDSGKVDPAIGGELRLEFPDISTAAWRAAQSSAAGPYLDYEWMLQVGRVYELYEEYVYARREFYNHYVMLAARLSPDGVFQGEARELRDLARPVFGHLVLVNALHGQVRDDLGAVRAGSVWVELIPDPAGR